MANILQGDMAYEIPQKPEYDPIMRKLKTSDPANAETIFNPLFGQLVNNTHAVKLALDELIEALSIANVDYSGDIEGLIVSRGALKRLTGISYTKETQTLNITPNISGGVAGISYDSENGMLSFE